MALQVNAQVIRDLIVEGSYAVECIEQREHGRIAVMLVLKSRNQPITLQIETTDQRLAGLFQALLQDHLPPKADRAGIKVGSQVVPVVGVDAVPADRPQAPRRKPRAPKEQAVPKSEAAPKRGERRRAALRQLILMPQEAPSRGEPTPEPAKRRTRSTVSNGRVGG